MCFTLIILDNMTLFLSYNLEQDKITETGCSSLPGMLVGTPMYNSLEVLSSVSSSWGLLPPRKLVNLTRCLLAVCASLCRWCSDNAQECGQA